MECALAHFKVDNTAIINWINKTTVPNEIISDQLKYFGSFAKKEKFGF